MKQLIDLGRVPTRENMENTPLCDAVPNCNVDRSAGQAGDGCICNVW